MNEGGENEEKNRGHKIWPLTQGEADVYKTWEKEQDEEDSKVVQEMARVAATRPPASQQNGLKR